MEERAVLSGLLDPHAEAETRDAVRSGGCMFQASSTVQANGRAVLFPGSPSQTMGGVYGLWRGDIGTWDMVP